MDVGWREAAPGVRALHLESEDLQVEVLPDLGCDVHSLVDRRTGVDVLYKTPWGLRSPGHLPWAPDSATAWLERYAGGWQLLLPNAGAASWGPGVAWGFHGEACRVPWSVGHADDHEVAVSTRLARAPLSVERSLSVDGPAFTIRETVTNLAPDPVELMWSHHPAFGSPFLAEGVEVDAGATTLTADDRTPGTDLAAGSVHPWPKAVDRSGVTVDFGVVPGPGSQRATLAYLEGFDEGWVTITNRALALGVRLTWPAEVFGSAWLWQELCASEGFPWFRTAYVMAVEPATTVGNSGLDAARREGRQPFTLAGGARQEVVVRAEVFDPDRQEHRGGRARP